MKKTCNVSVSPGAKANDKPVQHRQQRSDWLNGFLLQITMFKQTLKPKGFLKWLAFSIMLLVSFGESEVTRLS